MKTLFILKYIGKTCLITCAVLALVRSAGMSFNFNLVVIAASVAYCIGSIKYQFKLRAKKQAKFQYKA